MTTDKFVIYDFETLSTKQSAVCLSMGVLVIDTKTVYRTFEELEATGIQIKFDIKEQISMGRHVSKSTLEWWKSQGEAAKAITKPSEKDISIKKLPALMEAYFKKHDFDPKKNHAYCRGHFDYPILQDIYEMLETPCIIPFWNSRDIRTFVDIMGGTTWGKLKGWKPNEKIVLHNSLHDCINDYMMMEKCYEIAYDGN